MYAEETRDATVKILNTACCTAGFAASAHTHPVMRRRCSCTRSAGVVFASRGNCWNLLLCWVGEEEKKVGKRVNNEVLVLGENSHISGEPRHAFTLHYLVRNRLNLPRCLLEAPKFEPWAARECGSSSDHARGHRPSRQARELTTAVAARMYHISQLPTTDDCHSYCHRDFGQGGTCHSQIFRTVEAVPSTKYETDRRVPVGPLRRPLRALDTCICVRTVRSGRKPLALPVR